MIPYILVFHHMWKTHTVKDGVTHLKCALAIANVVR